MPKRIDLPSGAWADLAEPHELTERRRRPIKRVSMLAAKKAMSAGVDLTEPPDPSEETRAAMTAGEMATLDQQRQEWHRQVFMVLDVEESLDADAVYVAAFTLGWSYTDGAAPVPVTGDSVLDIPVGDFDALKAAVAPLIKAVFLDTSPKDLSQSSPTGPSSA